jgi:hypothetical protein
MILASNPRISTVQNPTWLKSEAQKHDPGIGQSRAIAFIIFVRQEEDRSALPHGSQT